MEATTTTGDTRATRQARDAMNRAVVACEDEILAERDARLSVRDMALSEQLRRQIVERESFIDDLQNAVASLGGRPEQGASSLAWGRSILRHVHAFVGGWHEGDACRALVHAAERTARAYDDALEGWLPADARFGMQRHRGAIRRDLDEARRLRAIH